MRIFQGDERNDQVALCLFREMLILCGDILKQGRIAELNLITSLFESYAKHFLVLDGSRYVVGVNLNDIVCTLAFCFQDFDSFVGKIWSDYAI